MRTTLSSIALFIASPPPPERNFRVTGALRSDKDTHSLKTLFLFAYTYIYVIRRERARADLESAIYTLAQSCGAPETLCRHAASARLCCCCCNQYNACTHIYIHTGRSGRSNSEQEEFRSTRRRFAVRYQKISQGASSSSLSLGSSRNLRSIAAREGPRRRSRETIYIYVLSSSS